ncbi:MAG: sigma-54 dependent transcriptional regulator [Gemmatimonadetes bacterium]|nr:sigma-54 dependent transcriptional regulator [Gemmatimonadota bacterium]
MATILCIDDEPTVLQVICRTLENAGHRTIGLSSVAEAFDMLQTEPVDLILSDYRMPEATGLEFLQRLREAGTEVPLIMLTAHASVEHAVASMKAGALDYVTKPIRSDQLKLVVEQALEFLAVRRTHRRLREAPRAEDERIVGETEALRQVMQRARAVSRTRATILIQGESGTGKELVARAIHADSDWADGPFVTINCAALPESLVESTLFGHEKGAFTGAIRQVKGAFERAHNGTLLLDEISEMRLDLQAKLLRVLQEREFERVGGSAPIRVSVRVIATTNRDLATEVREGRFREDLYYRLSVVPLLVPPLRERLEDLPALVHHFVQRSAREVGTKIDAVLPGAMALLAAHPWPGNVRELAHAVERAVILSDGPVIGPDAFDLLPGRRITGTPGPRSANTGYAVPTLNIAEAERALIERALATTSQNRTRAADLLGISVRTLRNKLNRPDSDEE